MTLLAALAANLPLAAQSPDQTPPPDTSTTSQASTPPTPPAGPTHHTKRTKVRHAETEDDDADKLSVRMKLGDGLRVWHPSRRQIGISFAPGGEPPNPVQLTVDTDKLRKYLSTLAPYVRRLPTNASVAVAKPNAGDDGMQPVPARIVSSQPGAVLDIDAAVDAIQKAVTSDPATLHVALPLKLTPARVRGTDLPGIDTRIGYFVTHFNPGEVGRTKTVRRAISLIDNTIVAPGGVFSINERVGERTEKRGFGIGHVFVDGKMDKQVGGGMCQVATTLFNAAMLADLKIVERHQHVRTVPYVEPGRDATVYWGQKDFKIQNDTQYPIYISYKTTRRHAIVALYGHGVPGRKVRLVSSHRRLAERHFTGLFYRVVTMPDGTTQKGKVYHSEYKWTPALDFQR
jgi:vancomycin resistance protein YoaR